MLKTLTSFFTVKIPDADSRIWGLDLIRCIAVLDVVKIHLWQMIVSKYGFEMPDFWPIRGVQLFFVLSGFLIGGIIIRQTERRGWSVPNMFRFMCRRWFRTLPNYYAVLIANILLQYLINGPAGLKDFSWHFFTFTYNFMTVAPPFFMESWSISIEEWFYMFYALAAALLYRFLSAQHHIRPISIGIALAMIAIPTLLRCTEYYQSNASLNGTVAFRIDGIAYGVVAAWFYYYYERQWEMLKWPMFVLGILLMFIVRPHAGFFNQVFAMSILSFGYVLCFPLLNAIRRAPAVIGYFVQVVSQLSYSLYLLNLGIAGGITLWLFHPGPGASLYLIASFYLVLLWVLSLVFYKGIERPFLELRDKYYP